MSSRKLIFAPGETDVWFPHRFADYDQKQRRIGAAVVLREMAAQADGFGLVSAAELEARAAELEAEA